MGDVVEKMARAMHNRARFAGEEHGELPSEMLLDFDNLEEHQINGALDLAKAAASVLLKEMMKHPQKDSTTAFIEDFAIQHNIEIGE